MTTERADIVIVGGGLGGLAPARPPARARPRRPARHPDDQDKALDAYEETMLALATAAGTESAVAMAHLFEADAADWLVAVFSGA